MHPLFLESQHLSPLRSQLFAGIFAAEIRYTKNAFLVQPALQPTQPARKTCHSILFCSALCGRRSRRSSCRYLCIPCIQKIFCLLSQSTCTCVFSEFFFSLYLSFFNALYSYKHILTYRPCSLSPLGTVASRCSCCFCFKLDFL